MFDTYRAHISKTFESEICNYDNINFVLIPGGMTYLLQPLDASINKNFKESVKTSWKDFMALKKRNFDNLRNFNKKSEESKDSTKCSHHSSKN